MKKKIIDYLKTVNSKDEKNPSDKILLNSHKVYRKFKKIFWGKESPPLGQRFKSASDYSFVTLEDVLLWTSEWVKTFPQQYDIIFGVPRSGLLVANIIALKLAKPITTPELFLDDYYWISEQIEKRNEFKRVLLVDDSVSSGKTLGKNLLILNSYNHDLDITTAALIITGKAKNMVDLHCQELEQPRIFEWNFLHAKKGVLACDLDGVICENCPAGIDENEAAYTQWIKNVRPYLIPAFEIDSIVTNRLEKYRHITERWLKDHGVRHQQLLMWDINSKDERKGNFTKNKVKLVKQAAPQIVWESSFHQASKIFEETNIPVLCIDCMELITE